MGRARERTKRERRTARAFDDSWPPFEKLYLGRLGPHISTTPFTRSTCTHVRSRGRYFSARGAGAGDGRGRRAPGSAGPGGPAASGHASGMGSEVAPTLRPPSSVRPFRLSRLRRAPARGAVQAVARTRTIRPGPKAD